MAFNSGNFHHGRIHGRNKYHWIPKNLVWVCLVNRTKENWINSRNLWSHENAHKLYLVLLIQNSFVRNVRLFEQWITKKKNNNINRQKDCSIIMKYMNLHSSNNHRSIFKNVQKQRAKNKRIMKESITL